MDDPAENKRARIVIGALAAIVVVGALVVLSTKVSGPADQSPGPATPTAYAIGQPVDGDSYQFVVTKVSTPQSVGTDFDRETASDGGVLVDVEYTVQNTSDKPIAASSVPDVVMVDQAGTEYHTDAGKTGAEQLAHPVDRKVWSDLNPGIRERGSAVFEVSKSAFDPAKWQLAIGSADGPHVQISIKPAA